MQLIANTLALSAKLKNRSQKSLYLFDESSQWHYTAELSMGTPNDYLFIDHSVDGTSQIIGRGKFEKVSTAKLIVMNDNPVSARFVLLLHDSDGLPVLSDGFIGIDVNHPDTNTGAQSFEMQFIAANFDEKVYCFGFCASDPGEPDTGVFIATDSRKQVLLCYKVANAAPRLHWNHARLQEFIRKKLGDKNNKEYEEGIL